MIYTAFCQAAEGGGTTWVSTVTADNVEAAIQEARECCANDWEEDPENIRCLGLAEGTVALVHWDDLD